ncbi:MAG: GNAT family N-acetyltransferase [Anaerolineae bacterium]|nr:GNAT family N-acetyltransferase [Anaerolineae bacterium]
MHTTQAKDMTVTIYACQERPDLQEQDYRELAPEWPTFMFHDPYAAQHYPTMYERCPDFQFYVVTKADRVVASGNSIPLVWDGTEDDLPTGWDDGLARGAQGALDGIAPNALCAIQVTVSSKFLGHGLGELGVQTMLRLAREHGFHALIAPVRPTVKAQYPLTPMERYIAWTRDDGQLFDPWMRIHVKLGAQVIKIAPESMKIPGTVAQWEEWAGMQFPDSGLYVVPGALVPITIDRDRDEGVYIEPNVWMVHRLD